MHEGSKKDPKKKSTPKPQDTEEKFCFDFQKRSCTRGASCPYAHRKELRGRSATRGRPNSPKGNKGDKPPVLSSRKASPREATSASLDMLPQAAKLPLRHRGPPIQRSRSGQIPQSQSQRLMQSAQGTPCSRRLSTPKLMCVRFPQKVRVSSLFPRRGAGGEVVAARGVTCLFHKMSHCTKLIVGRDDCRRCLAYET